MDKKGNVSMSTKFKVGIEKDINKLFLRVTHNGKQWSTIRIENPLEEIPQIIGVLQGYLVGHYEGTIQTLKDKLLDKEMMSK